MSTRHPQIAKQRPERRIRYGMGPGGVVYVLVTGLILGASIYTQANLLFWAFGLMIGGLFISGVLSWRALRGIDAQRLLPSHGVAGEALVLRYHLTNQSWMPLFGLMIQETWGRGISGWKRVGPVTERPALLLAPPHGWVLHLGPNQACQAEAPCWPLRRGPLDFDQIVISTAFPFNVIRKTVIFRQPQQTLIYPHLYRINRRLMNRISQVEVTGRRQTDRSGGNEEFYGLREYRPGDSLKTIDWRHSARTGELVSREMTKPSPPRMMILLDLSDPGLREAPESRHHKKPKRHKPQRGEADTLSPHELMEERAISLATSLVCDGYLYGYQIGLAVEGPPCPVFQPHHSLPHRARLFEALARLVPARRDLKPDSPAVDPAVIVTPLPIPLGNKAHAQAVVLSAADLDDYIIDSHQGDLLSTRVLPTSRREVVGQKRFRHAGPTPPHAGTRGGG